MSGSSHSDTRLTTKIKYLRFRWSHDLVIHRLAVRLYNGIMRRIPFEIKYGAGQHLRQKKPPYCLLRTGSVVVQVGAPKDTLQAGRSRGMFFSLLLRGSGKVIIVGPDSESLREFRLIVKRQGIQNVILCPVGAWSTRGTVRLFVNDFHPASSFTEGTKQYDAKRLKAFRVAKMPADSIDNILNEIGTNPPDLISITKMALKARSFKGCEKLLPPDYHTFPLRRRVRITPTS